MKIKITTILRISNVVVAVVTLAGPAVKTMERPGGVLIVGQAETDVNRIPVAYLDKARKECGWMPSRLAGWMP